MTFSNTYSNDSISKNSAPTFLKKKIKNYQVETREIHKNDFIEMIKRKKHCSYLWDKYECKKKYEPSKKSSDVETEKGKIIIKLKDKKEIVFKNITGKEDFVYDKYYTYKGYYKELSLYHVYMSGHEWEEDYLIDASTGKRVLEFQGYFLANDDKSIIVTANADLEAGHTPTSVNIYEKENGVYQKRLEIQNLAMIAAVWKDEQTLLGVETWLPEEIGAPFGERYIELKFTKLGILDKVKSWFSK